MNVFWDDKNFLPLNLKSSEPITKSRTNDQISDVLWKASSSKQELFSTHIFWHILGIKDIFSKLTLISFNKFLEFILINLFLFFIKCSYCFREISKSMNHVCLYLIVFNHLWQFCKMVFLFFCFVFFFLFGWNSIYKSF